MIGSGPVRNLKCFYNKAEMNPLSCKWMKPENSNGQIRFYKVEITHNNRTIFDGNSTNRYIGMERDLRPDDIYTVHVTPITDKLGASTSFDLVYHKRSK